ncbi:N-acetylmuramoyl-L-alanine amidase family protein [Clostridium botulinum]|uniref:N-acetylmuramoyl-L-alanine amidase family protein n=1 Tax=Clostridium botulinum TaxID=1491 RepID=UPI0013FB4117|nr:N-acetylmuramoyl-L-alanine amidase family protein [Clostridium botulinum]MBN1059831.1 N-acetylmuramoyl-L-alanine amidase family protein [Clostridium botulinum]MBN1062977.1 N-acetylmuramoyl-L-alanine amidase family protein [Clostridium botulinum]NFF80795.1 N-acetylmuramoyl-L-alanine amidase family protein [Clostridium botulinum]HBJ2621734.1 N-acetylmuramoyl-L-alanine amidase family protein [Clostridium botulinum]
MFNRANKMTALLVAAAAVVSLVPATGVNAADYKRINSEEGKVYHAVAFKDGQFYLDGEVNDKDEAAYYLAGGKYNELKDVDSNSEISTYGEKYVNVEDGDYFVDLTNGKVDDENLAEQDEDDAAAALKKKIKDKADDRYADDDKEPTVSLIKEGNKFGESWFKAEYKTSKTTNNINENTSTLNIYTDVKGNYIDADYNLGSIKVKVAEGTTTSSSVTVENTDKTYKNNKNDAKVSASVEEKAILGQDSKFIYRLATVKVNAENGVIAEVNGKEEYNGSTVTLNVIQKISKEQASDTVDGAKYAKTVNTYVISNDKGENSLTGDVKTLSEYLDKIIAGDKNVKATIANGKIVVYAVDADNKTIDAQTATLKTKAGWYYTDCESAKTGKDVKVSDDANDKVAVDTDVDGNLWKLDGGFVYKWDNVDDWDKMYKVDGSMDQLSVYNKDNMVLWNQDDEVYSVVGQKADKEEEKPEVEVKDGWSQAADGTWTYVKGGVKATGWLQDGANWYLLNEAGIMQTGWQTVGGTWYYLAGNGAMQTGWQNLGGNWYFLQPSGAMVTGWYNDNGTWYFCDGSGKMLANTTVNGYVLGANGAWVK